ncbi:hypothetical protein PF005_g30951 [Phytophthora fragariae]|uniref:RxLR effector protein n=2 Tax=Phytophthora TaxID=4783 RepID=A0A6A3PUH7_9STRA|nr:hypothetical protein PF003_g4037 [Phytophthora fragariae]KAE8959260.1 hypothetical protein PR002_g30594 [Phytophthora rubi]KAE8918575.1 hypothetical protein PF009_g31112 [Phytophthora fragariae]KAE8959309.1 hypothetical protein PR001_g30759 [Phytophthora rubi]KAE8960241.1 hypothetical protein PF011_g30162 [Phytophthora fragariae]
MQVLYTIAMFMFTATGAFADSTTTFFCQGFIQTGTCPALKIGALPVKPAIGHHQSGKGDD